MSRNEKLKTPASSEPIKDDNAKVLVCDDSKIVRIAAKKILDSRFNLELAEDGEQAWQKICNDPHIQVVFTDLGMPNLNGFGLIQRVRTAESERIRNMPMIVITGATDDEDTKKKIYEVGATDFITKPFKSTAIIARADAHTSYRRATKTLQDNVNLDILTGVLNRRGYDDSLAKDISFVNRHGENIAVALFELDDFKQIHDRIGKNTSEQIIKQVAKTLTAAVRKEDSVARDGHARFIVSLPMAKTEGVITFAKRICQKVASFKLRVGDQLIELSTSVGIAATNKGVVAESDSLLQYAQQALTNAQALGRGEVQFIKLDEDDRDGEDESQLSIDGLLEQIEQGQEDLILDKIDNVLSRLGPLIALMSTEQRQRLIGLRP